MNISSFHQETKEVDVKAIFQDISGTTLSIQILAGARFDKHQTKIPAVLLCLKGHAKYEDENGHIEFLNSGDFMDIKINLTHWIDAIETCQLILFK